jgi:3-oxoacyl-[acyl-carrier protein] reductase
MSIKTAIITGGSRGIGRIIVNGLIEDDYKVFIVSRNKANLDKAIRELNVEKSKCIAIEADISSSEQVKYMVDQCLKSSDGIDLLVNNAGIQGPIGPLWENDDSEWKYAMEINMYSVFLCTKYVLNQMIPQNYGRIVNLSGGGAAYARPFFSSYACTKTALLRLTENVQDELIQKGYDIDVFAMAPGGVRTSMTKQILKNMNLAGQKSYLEAVEIEKSGGTTPQKIQNLIRFFCSAKSKSLRGKLLHVNEDYFSLAEKIESNPQGGLLRREKY